MKGGKTSLKAELHLRNRMSGSSRRSISTGWAFLFSIDGMSKVS
jgi:hypothetical protein